MPIKRVSIKHLLKKGFFLENALNTISKTSREQCPKVFLTVYTAKIRGHEISQILWTIKV